VQRNTAVVLTFIAIVVAGACSDDGGDSPTTTSRAPAATTSSSSSTSTSSAASTSTTVAATSTTLAPDPLTLHADGIGDQHFGDAAASVVDAVTDELGPPTDDRVESAATSSYGVCPGTEVRVAEWGGFVVLSTDGATPFAGGGTVTFFDWQLRDLGAATPPLSTADGIDLGDTVADLRAVYGDALAVTSDEVLGHVFTAGPSGAQLRGSLTGSSDDASITSLSAGSACGE
jgi:hypothetical protein